MNNFVVGVKPIKDSSVVEVLEAQGSVGICWVTVDGVEIPGVISMEVQYSNGVNKVVLELLASSVETVHYEQKDKYLPGSIEDKVREALNLK